MQEIKKPNLMNIKLVYLALSFLVQREALIWFSVFYYLRFTVTAFPRMNAMGITWASISRSILERGTYLKGRLIDRDGYFTIDRKVTVMIKKIARLNCFTIDEAD